MGKCELPETVEELEDYSIQRIGSTLNTKRVYNDVTSRTDICSDVLRNILHVSVIYFISFISCFIKKNMLEDYSLQRPLYAAIFSAIFCM